MDGVSVRLILMLSVVESTGACQREILKVLRMGKRKRDTSQFVEHGRQTAVNR